MALEGEHSAAFVHQAFNLARLTWGQYVKIVWNSLDVVFVVFQQDVLTVGFYHVREETELGFELVDEALVEEDFFKFVGSSFFDNLAVIFVGDELMAVANTEDF